MRGVLRQETTRGSRSDAGHSAAANENALLSSSPMDQFGEVGWVDRRKQARSFVYRGDWKLATAIYIAIVILVTISAYL